jgi:hypothetical protein
MRPYTSTDPKNGGDEEQLRKHWRGNRCSKGRNGDPGGKGEFEEKIGNNNYHRKKKDRVNKKRHRQQLKRLIDEELELIDEEEDF